MCCMTDVYIICTLSIVNDKNKMSLRGARFLDCHCINRKLVIARRQEADEAIFLKSFIICFTMFRNEIATPFGLAMTIILGMRIYDT